MFIVLWVVESRKLGQESVESRKLEVEGELLDAESVESRTLDTEHPTSHLSPPTEAFPSSHLLPPTTKTPCALRYNKRNLLNPYFIVSGLRE